MGYEIALVNGSGDEEFTDYAVGTLEAFIIAKNLMESWETDSNATIVVTNEATGRAEYEYSEAKSKNLGYIITGHQADMPYSEYMGYAKTMTEVLDEIKSTVRNPPYGLNFDH